MSFKFFERKKPLKPKPEETSRYYGTPHKLYEEAEVSDND